jgi:hypothetical protein
MGVRHVPELTFLADRSGRFQARIDELMGRSRKTGASRRGAGRPAVSQTPSGPIDVKPA